MTFSTRIGSLKASVRRLEALAGKGAQCSLCRIGVRLLSVGSGKESSRAEGAVRVKCEFCQNQFLRSLKGIPEGDREFYRLTCPFTMEDEFTDPRAHAAALWRAYRPWPEEGEGAGATRRRGAERKAKNDPRVRTLNALRAQYQEARERRRKRLVARYGADPFHEHRRLVEAIRKSARDAHSEELYVPGLPELRAEETRYLVCAGLEKIIVGRTLFSTEESLARLRGRIAETVEGARREKEREQEERRRREDELREGRGRSGKHSQCNITPQAEPAPPGPPAEDYGGLPWNEEELKSISSTVIVRPARPQQTAFARARARGLFPSSSKDSGHVRVKGRG